MLETISRRLRQRSIGHTDGYAIAAPGVYEFTCQLGILRGRLVVEQTAR